MIDDLPRDRESRAIEAGVAVAVATDFNPGTAPSYDLPLASGRRLGALVTRR